MPRTHPVVTFALVSVGFVATVVSAGCTHGGAMQASQPASGQPSVASQPGLKSPLLINVTRGRDDLHAASMALGLARAGLERGHQVTVFLNVGAPALASKALGPDVRYSDFPPVTQMIQDIMARGGRVLVCGHCATLQDVTADSLLPGAVMSQHGDVVDLMAPGTIALSY